MTDLGFAENPEPKGTV